MANKSLCEYSALTPDNIRTGPIVVVGNATFELKRALINVDGVFWYTKHVHYTLVWI
jgi:hypothetical protein